MLFPFFTQACCYISCTLALLRQKKNIDKSKSYLNIGYQYIKWYLANEILYNILYMLIITNFGNYKGIFVQFNLMMHFWIGIAEYIALKHKNHY